MVAVASRFYTDGSMRLHSYSYIRRGGGGHICSPGVQVIILLWPMVLAGLVLVLTDWEWNSWLWAVASHMDLLFVADRSIQHDKNILFVVYAMP